MKFTDRITNQRGVALIAVIFILVALGGLGVTVSKLSQNQAKQASSAVGVQDSYYAAQSGLEWAFQQVTDNTGTAGYTAATGYSALVGNRTLPNGDTFTIAYTAPNISSTAKKGNDERQLVLASFDTLVPQVPGGGGGGGTGPSSTCATSQGDGKGVDLFTQYVAAGNRIDGVTGGQSGITPDNFSIPTFPTATYNNQTFGSTTSLSPNTPSADNPELYYADLQVNNNVSLTLNGPTGVGKYLTVYVKGDFDLKGNSTLNINGNVRFVVGVSGTTKDIKVNGATVNITNGALFMMASGEFKAENSFKVNSGAGSLSDNLLVMTQKEIKFENNGSAKGGFYSMDEVKIENNPTITGAMVGKSKVEAENNPTITWDSNAAKNVTGNIKTC
ncbi:MAG: pilus assembly PilX N-terminal domain-containing protein [Nitrospinae bacterium]|nr:pilus assembly PilX N-terminal domain-containing protein [Nitrospinota bacterium]